jgi:hypothetical protein
MAIENRGFASLSPQRRKEIARLGGLKSKGGGRKPKAATPSKDDKGTAPSLTDDDQ